MTGGRLPRTLRRGGARALLAAVALAALAGPLLAADDEDLGQQSEGLTDRLSNQIKEGAAGISHRLGLDKPPKPPPPEAPSGCPTIAILPGTESQRVMAGGTAAGNLGVRYQFSLENVGRECSISGNRVSIRVGASGRVLLGPAGAPGRFDVPIRVVVYSEAQQKPVQSKLYKVPASIAGGESATAFQFASDNIVVPVTFGTPSAELSIKVGFDGAGSKTGEVAKAKRGHRARAAKTAGDAASAAAN